MAGLGGALKPRKYQGPGYTRREDRVDVIAADMMSRDNPLMAKARASGQQLAASRGLLNSSLAGAASMSAALDQVAPMASQTAGQEFEKNRAGQDHLNTRSQMRLGSDLKRDEMKDAYGFDRGLAKLQADEQRKTLWAGSRADRANMRADYRLRGDLSAQEAQQQRRAIREDFAGRERLATRDNRFTAEQAAADRAFQDKLSRREVSADTRRVAQTAMDNSFRDYEASVQSIMANPDLPAEERNRMIGAARQLLERKGSYYGRLYSMDIAWPR